MAEGGGVDPHGFTRALISSQVRRPLLSHPPYSMAERSVAATQAGLAAPTP